MKKNIAILLVESNGFWGARSPDVLDVYAVGPTREEACDRLRKALTVHMEVLLNRSLPVPAFTAQVDSISTDLLPANER